jgi:NADPH:quinone reductase-like Zn-dependent oxidoreductase
LQDHFEAQKAQADILNQCSRLFDQNRLKIDLAQTFHLPEAAKAHSFLATGSMQGKIALVM